MSAALAHAPVAPPELPAQPGLLGIEPPPAMPELRYAISGRVHRRPEVRIAPDGRHGHLVVRLEQPPHAGHARPPFVVTHSADATGIPALERLAAELAAGADALCICQGVDFDVSRQHYRAWRCDRITAVPRAAIGAGAQPAEATP